MKKKKDDYITRFRNAVKEFVTTKLAYGIERGNYDQAFQAFLSANIKDKCEFTFKLHFVSNDILFMRLLLGERITPEILSRLKKIWDKEECRE